MNTTLKDWQTNAIERFGYNSKDWIFICPECGVTQSKQDFLDIGMSTHMTETLLGYTCVRHWTDKGCHATNIGPIKLEITPGEIRNTFSFKL